MGGSDDPSNLVLLTVEEHAEAHRKLFEKYGRQEDYVAWKGLAGEIGKEECIRLARLEGARKGGLAAGHIVGKYERTPDIKAKISQGVAKYMRENGNPMKGMRLPKTATVREECLKHFEEVKHELVRPPHRRCKKETLYAEKYQHLYPGKSIQCLQRYLNGRD